MYITKDEEFLQANCLLLGFKMPVLNIIMTMVKYQIFLARCVQKPLSFAEILLQLEKFLCLGF